MQNKKIMKTQKLKAATMTGVAFLVLKKNFLPQICEGGFVIYYGT